MQHFIRHKICIKLFHLYQVTDKKRQIKRSFFHLKNAQLFCFSVCQVELNHRSIGIPNSFLCKREYNLFATPDNKYPDKSSTKLITVKALGEKLKNRIVFLRQFFKRSGVGQSANLVRFIYWRSDARTKFIISRGLPWSPSPLVRSQLNRESHASVSRAVCRGETKNGRGAPREFMQMLRRVRRAGLMSVARPIYCIRFCRTLSLVWPCNFAAHALYYAAFNYRAVSSNTACGIATFRRTVSTG